MKLRNTLLIIALVTFSTGALWASSYRGRDGQYKTDEYTVKVHWADIYNMRPKPKHWIRSSVKIIPGPKLQKKGFCILTNKKKQYKMKANSREFRGKHIMRFYISCNFKSNVNKHMHSINQEFTVRQLPSKDGSPFGKLLEVKPVKN